MTRPIVFLSDYGFGDPFVGVCHGVVARLAPDARVIDLTHAVPPEDVQAGAVTLAAAAPFMPQDAVYLAVVDPGVGTPRRSIAVAAGSGADLVGPDNGLLSLAWVALDGLCEAVEITPEHGGRPPSRTFHGRDVFAPAAARVAAGARISQLGRAVSSASLMTLDEPRAEVSAGSVSARVISVDRFGNVQLDARPEDLDRAGLASSVNVSGRRMPCVGTFAEVAEGEAAAIVDSDGRIALVVNRGRADRLLGLEPGSTVVLAKP